MLRCSRSENKPQLMAFTAILPMGALLHPSAPRLPRLARVEPAVDRRLQSGLLSILVGAALTSSPLPAFSITVEPTEVRLPAHLAAQAPAAVAITPEKRALEQALQRARAENDPTEVRLPASLAAQAPAAVAVTPEKAALEQALQRARAENDYLKSVTQKQEQENVQLQSKAASPSSEEQARISELARVRTEISDKAALAQKQGEQLRQAETKLEAAQAAQRASAAALARAQADTPQDLSWLLPVGLSGVVVVQALAIFKVMQDKQALEEQLSARR